MNTPPDTRFLEVHLGYWLRFVSNHVSNAFRLKVEAHGVQVAEWVVLRLLYRTEGINPSQLADTLGMTRGGVSKLIDRLVDRGLLNTRTARDDRRYQTVHLTPAGNKLVPTLTKLADENDEEFFGCLSAAQRRDLISLMKRVIAHGRLDQVPTA